MRFRSTAAFFVTALALSSCATTTTREVVWTTPAGAETRTGRVEWVREVVQRTEGNPTAGAVMGAVVGGLLGSAITGHQAGAVAGAAAGAVVGAGASEGHSERRTYDVAVLFDNGERHVFRYLGYPPFRPQQRVVLTSRGLMGQDVVARPPGSVSPSADSDESTADSQAEAEPTTPMPQEIPPAPPASADATPNAQPLATPEGQWVYTAQYGWLWMPYGAQYTFTPAYDSGDPYMYVYYPAVGWTWVDAPWLWGWGVVPHFSVSVGTRFRWYGHGWGTHWRGGHRSQPYRTRNWVRSRPRTAPPHYRRSTQPRRPGARSGGPRRR